MGLQLQSVEPPAALPGGDVMLHGRGFSLGPERRAEVRVAGMNAPVSIATDTLVVAQVPESAQSGAVTVVDPGGESGNGDRISDGIPLEVAVQIAENLHPVCNPAVDAEGNIVVTLSGSRGQKTPVSLFRLDTNYALKAWNSTITNPSGLAFDHAGSLFVSSRHDGAIYKVTPGGTATLHCEGLGVATGVAVDAEDNVYVGDRNGTIFKIDTHRNTFVFATLEPSVAAYHLAFGPGGYLYVTGPSISSHDTLWRISPKGEVEPFFRGLGRPQGLAFDAEGRLHAAASYQGRRGVMQIDGDGRAKLLVSGSNLVGLAFANGPALILATSNALYHLDWKTAGAQIPPPLAPITPSIAPTIPPSGEPT